MMSIEDQDYIRQGKLDNNKDKESYSNYNIDNIINYKLSLLSPMKSISKYVKIDNSKYNVLLTDNITKKQKQISPPQGELYANPAASQAMLDDMSFDVQNWLADEIANEFSRSERPSFIYGSGCNQPKGFLTGTVNQKNDLERENGILQFVITAKKSGFTNKNPHDCLIDLIHCLDARFRSGACFVMNSLTLSHLKKFKTDSGAFIFHNSMNEGQRDTLLGYPVVILEDMPDIAPNSMSIAFGNFSEGYIITESSSTNITRDPFSNKPFVHFYATKKIGGQIYNSNAIKLLCFSDN